MPGIATNRSNITLPTDVSQEIIQKTQQASAVMQLARQIDLPGRGLTIPVITSDPEAAWVAETGAKPVSNPGLSTKLMQAYKLAVIVPFSDEFRRDAAALYDALVARLPLALAARFDQTVIGAVAKPGENFDNFAECTAQSLIKTDSHSVYDGLVAAYEDIAAGKGSLNGFALSPAAIGILLGATDSTGRPLFISSTAEGGVNRVLGARTLESRGVYKPGAAPADSSAGTPAIVGIAGDWSQAMYGTVEGVQIRFADQTGLTINSEQVNLWEHNMFAVRAEIELGFRADTACFNLLAGAVPQS
ncbi:MAG: phage major capsid protein [Candidatus Faecousia sp.]|nr:phage major capsid protein [Candidatus Faecousia sp.]